MMLLINICQTAISSGSEICTTLFAICRNLKEERQNIMQLTMKALHPGPDIVEGV